MIVAPDGQKIYTLPDLLLWIISHQDNALSFLKSEKLKEWLKSEGYEDLLEEIEHTESVDDIVNAIKRMVFSADREIVISRAEAIEKILKSVK